MIKKKGGSRLGSRGVSQRVMCVKQTISWFLAFMILFSASSLIRSSGFGQKPWENPYSDVMETDWSYQYITELNKDGILPDSPVFEGKKEENRGNLVLYLYNLDTALFKDNKKKSKDKREIPFTDVDKGDSRFSAIRWAYENGVVSGTSDTSFSPDANLTREQVCTILMRYAHLANLSLIQVVNPDQFVDSLYIADYARSYVTACELSGLVKGYADGYFYPEEEITREECATVVYRLKSAAQAEKPKNIPFVDTSPDAYTALYSAYVDIPFVELVPQSAEVSLDYFAKTVFIGDSVSLMLKAYANSTGALGSAQFLVAGSMSATNMLTGQILPEYPAGSGQHPKIEDSVAACGAKVVYIMLGMDNIGYLGIDRAAADMITIIGNITAKTPDVTIVIQSVTPMADSSTSYSSKLNNKVIDNFNLKMRQLCHDNKWYYLNVSEVCKDSRGFLIKEYCSDYGKMGMHFNYKGTAAWVDYLKTHVPDALK